MPLSTHDIAPPDEVPILVEGLRTDLYVGVVLSTLIVFDFRACSIPLASGLPHALLVCTLDREVSMYG